MAVAVKRDLHNSLRDQDVYAWQGAGLEKAIEIRCAELCEPVQFNTLGLVKPVADFFESFGNALLLFVEERLAQDQKHPVAVGDQDVMEQFAQLLVFAGRFVLLNGAQEAGVCPPLVPDQFIDHRHHGSQSIKRSRGFAGSVLSDAGCDPVLEENQVEEAIEFVPDLAQVADALEAEVLEEVQGGPVFRVHACDHRVFAGNPRLHNERFQEQRSDAVAAKFGGYVDGAFHGVAITGPGTEIAETAEAADTPAVGGDKNRVVLLKACAPPGDAVGDAGRAVAVDGGGVGEDIVVDCGDLFEVGLDSFADLHAFSRC